MQNTFKHTIQNILLKTQKYLKIDVLYFAKGGFWLSMRHIINIITTLLQTILFANILPEATFGNFKYIITLANTFGFTFLTGMNTAVVQAVAQGNKSILKQSFLLQIKWSLVYSIACFISAGYYFFQNNTIFAICLSIIGLFNPIINASNTFMAYLIGEKNFKKLFQLSSLISIGTCIPPIIAILFTHNLIFLVTIYFTSSALIYFIFYKKIERQSLVFENTNNDQNESLKSLRYGNHLSVINIFSVLAAQADKIIVFHYLGAQKMALYMIATAFVEQSKGLLKIFSTVALPKFSQNTITQSRKTFFRKIAILSSLVLGMILIYILVTPFIFPIFFPKYIEAVHYSQVYSLLLFAYALSIPLLSLLQAKAKIRSLYTYTILSSCIQITLVFILLKIYGIWGAIIGKIIGEYINSILIGLFSKEVFTEANTSSKTS